MIDYYLLIKPKILLGNLVTFSTGFLLASKGQVDVLLFFMTLTGLALVMASSCVFNNYINRETDKKMERTKNRALVIGIISKRNALIFAVFLGLIGGLILLVYTNFLTFIVASIGFFVYVVLYSFWKCRTIYGTALGSIAGAVPPVVGYCAVSHRFDLGAVILFLMLVFWQMPHFFAIAMYHFEDYAAANIPVLPVQKGMLRTKIHMVLYIMGFILVSALLTFFDYTGSIYLVVALSFGLLWLGLCIKGFKSDDDKLFGRRMFQVSLLVITAICLVIPLGVV